MKGNLYLVCHPPRLAVSYMEKYRVEGYEVTLVTDINTLRGRECGKVAFEGDWESKWDIQGILESIEQFKLRCKDHEDKGPKLTEDFLDYGVEE